MGLITPNNSKCWNEKDYMRPGLTWPLRTTSLSVRVMPAGCIFGQKGPAAFVEDDNPKRLFEFLCVLNSSAFVYLVSALLARTELSRSFEVGLLEQTPFPHMSEVRRGRLATLGTRAWSLQRTLDTIEETSHAFLLPAALRARLGDYALPAIEAELSLVQSEIDVIAFDVYGFNHADRTAAQAANDTARVVDAESNSDVDGNAALVTQTDGLLSWAVGVTFGRFDWCLATGERAAPPEPEPFDPLPAISPGMLPDGAAPFHTHDGILADDIGHPHDLANLAEKVLARVDAPIPSDMRRWLQREFFALHLQRYSKSRRKAPIYWPLSTPSGSYTLWVYYPSLTSQTLYTAINDFLEPKRKEVDDDLIGLRNKGSARTRDDEKQFENLQTLARELAEMLDTLQGLARNYQPHHDDGVQIAAAPLWPLFQHKAWQKVLKETWAKLEKGDYDWAHLAIAYWPERVREKCKTDKSLAIVHGLEELYVEPDAAPKKPRSRKKAET